MTNRQKYNHKYGFSLDQQHSLKEIAYTTGFNRCLLRNVYRRALNEFADLDALNKRRVNAEQFAWSAVYKFGRLNGGVRVERSL
jgi:hypothetical protein